MRYLILVLTLFLILPSYAINWIEVTTPRGSRALVDTDSIIENKNFYFYNINVLNTYTNKNVVITIQSSIKKTLSARINFYTPEEYVNLDGDYEHITDKMTNKLETVEFGSIVYACYNLVKEIMVSKKVQIQI